ncbi:hypothetical protein AVEN_130066-1 [Araneus ventricosus]|uniref:Uncharacterized protein n=1 Tax=Araneus ventricosus TaxID=182803 RepID=A0A4Y2NS54_ARAVE|nr:hypothetical protein AVEN_60635-1 [Araneus ventricosus]GBN41831.1 hypothetical protein AVEN_130066-1 [Araneus ventricosus]
MILSYNLLFLLWLTSKWALRKPLKHNILQRTIENKVKCLHSKNLGIQTLLSNDEEDKNLEQVLICADWGMLLDAVDLRLIVKKLPKCT